MIIYVDTLQCMRLLLSAHSGYPSIHPSSFTYHFWQQSKWRCLDFSLSRHLIQLFGSNNEAFPSQLRDKFLPMGGLDMSRSHTLGSVPEESETDAQTT